MTESISDEAVCRTAPATPDLLINFEQVQQILFMTRILIKPGQAGLSIPD